MPVFGEAAAETSTATSASEPPSNSKGSPLHQDHSIQSLHPVMSSSYPITLKFMDVCYRVKMETNKSRTSNLRKIFRNSGPTSPDVESNNITPAVIRERVILNGITGMVSPGEILAILGPSGSGKSTLLNALAGRLHHGGHGRLTGTVLANNRKQPTKQIARRTGFVTQDDVLHPHLTVRETLVFCSLLRLPNSLSKQEKVSAAESVISELGLVKCENTIVGNSSVRGVSGGERKRVNIAHEMLINPSLLILDEPTSGLDSTAAFRLISTLGSLAQKGKTIVTSVHQPSSRVYQMFDSVLVLSEGRCLYFGKANQAMTYFDSIGFSPSFPMNPADFLLDLANGVCPLGNNKKDKPNVKQTLVSSYNSLLAPTVRAACMDSVPPTTTSRETMVGIIHTCREHSWNMCIGNIVFSWLNQFSILLERGIKVRRHECFDALRVFQVIAASLLAGILWWHSDYRNIQDRLGLLFSITVFWGVLPATGATFAFPQERAIFMKERASGMYTLSSYFMAKIIGGMSMELILPTIYLTITYWMAGLKPELGAFILTLMVILGYVLVSQGLGLAFGALIMDAKHASTVVTVTMLAFVLIGGFYVHSVPPCIAWMKYISSTFYSYRLLISVQYGDGREISSLMGCTGGGHVNHDHGDPVGSCNFIQEDIQGQMHPIFCAGIMLLMFVGYRLIAYLALRCRRY